MNTDYTPSTASTSAATRGARVPEQRRSQATETKAAVKTTELIAYVVAVIGVLIASAMIGDDGKGTDFFRADRAWFYVVLLTMGYMISRGLAKSGSREHYDA